MNRVILIDIDGTICDDIKNEESHLFSEANGDVITFFTARQSKDRLVTENWLNEKGFKYNGLIMDKPRIKDGQEYFWIDNRPVNGVNYVGNWTELIEVESRIKSFQ
jgi:hypothetical protein